LKKIVGNTINITIVGNKSDLEKYRSVDADEAQR
jgi:hypothetical protein